MNKKNTDIVKVIFTVIGVIVSIGAIAVLAYNVFKKYFKVTFECDGDCDSCDEECDKVIDSVPYTDEEEPEEQETAGEEDKSEDRFPGSVKNTGGFVRPCFSLEHFT